MIWSLAAIFVLLFLSAFFSGAETALTAASRPLMRELQKQGNRRACLVNDMDRHRDRLIGTILLGNNAVNISASALATSLLISWFGEAGIAFATLGMTLLVLIFSEILPKTYAIRNANTVALTVAPIMRVLTTVLAPLMVGLNALISLILKLFGVREAEKSLAQHLTELRGAIELHTEEQDEVRHERAMLKSVLELADVDVGEVMTHRRDLVTIDLDTPTDKIIAEVLTSSFTRIPLFRDNPDNIVGVLHAKALFRAVQAHQGAIETLNVEEHATKPWFIPATTSLLDQLQSFRTRREHFAIVVDEYGSLLGIVTLEDILEEIVGNIDDEHDIVIGGVRAQADGTLVIAGDVTIRDLNREFEWSLPDEEATTLAGLVIHESQRIPEPGQVFRFHGFRFEVLRRQKNRLISLRITPPETGGR
ncbi:MAG: HlyC/CorC family transporter [Rhodospirillaceae bacterium]|nr:HlyC/CorC family transporter [Rhodospirillaceae bacterium]